MDMLQFDIAYVNYLIIFLESNVYMCRILGLSGVRLHAYACFVWLFCTKKVLYS